MVMFVNPSEFQGWKPLAASFFCNGIHDSREGLQDSLGPLSCTWHHSATKPSPKTQLFRAIVFWKDWKMFVRHQRSQYSKLCAYQQVSESWYWFRMLLTISQLPADVAIQYYWLHCFTVLGPRSHTTLLDLRTFLAAATCHHSEQLSSRCMKYTAPQILRRAQTSSGTPWLEQSRTRHQGLDWTYWRQILFFCTIKLRAHSRSKEGHVTMKSWCSW